MPADRIATELREVYWICQQVSYSIPPSELREGLEIDFCEHAFKSFTARTMPKTSRFIRGRIAHIANGMMRIVFEPAFNGAVSITCGVEDYARFITYPLPEAKAARKRTAGRKRKKT